MSVFVPALGGFLVGVVVGIAGYVLLSDRISSAGSQKGGKEETGKESEWGKENSTKVDNNVESDFEQVLEAVDEPIALLDSDDTILFSNSAFTAFLGTDVFGEHIESALSAYSELSEQLKTGGEGVVEIRENEATIYYEICLFPFCEQTDSQLLLFHDVTDEQARRHRLEKQNEQLDRFAGLISHDLRNPLDVGIGRTNAMREMSETPEFEEHLDSTRDALQRMECIVTDVLTLARQGESIGEMETVSLEELCQLAWETVATADATLDVENEVRLTANPDGLRHILENLFRNAVEHAGEDTKVTVGTLTDNAGFYVEDTGPSIPVEERERVLEVGESSEENWTGLGLAIVERIATAHGWNLSVMEATNGGARFEFSGVEFEKNAVVTQQP